MTAPTNGSGGELLAEYQRFAGETAGKCLALAMSTDHPAPDEVLMGIFHASQELAAKARAEATPPAQVGAATDSGEGVRYETDDRGLFCKHCGLTALRHHAYVGKAGLYCTAYPTKPDAGKVIREFGARLAQVPDDTPDVAYCGVDMTHGEARKIRDAIASMSTDQEGLVESELWEACADLTDVLEAETEGFTNEEWAALGSAKLHAEDRIASLVRLTRARQNGSAGQASYRIEENGCA
jgi:hypothetical protein